MPLSLKEAQTVVELARAHAETIGVPMNIAVVDGGGHLLAFARMDRSILGSIDIRSTDGSLVGAIGVSGGMPAQDGEVARGALSGTTVSQST